MAKRKSTKRTNNDLQNIHITLSLTQALFIEVPVPSQEESEWYCICVLGV